MYSSPRGLVLGFHGCDVSVLEAVLSGSEMLRESKNTYDWLGHGIYFWENSPSRAHAFAHELSSRSKKSSNPIRQPAVIGAVIDLGLCLDLFDYENLESLKESYEILVASKSNPMLELPENRKSFGSEDLLLRDLDCAVVETLHSYRQMTNLRPFDSVRGAFQEGKELYPNAGFREKDHIQICVRNPNCIKGFFIPRSESRRHPTV